MMKENPIPLNNQTMTHRSAFIALLGRPNCGKSTLMNTLLGENLAVVTPLPQTTRKNLRGIYTDADSQLIFIDTPGVHRGSFAFNHSMVKESDRLIRRREVDIICCLVDSSRLPGEEEDIVARMVGQSGIPVVVVFNKKDLCKSIESYVASYFERFPTLKSAPHLCISATKKEAKQQFLSVIKPLTPEGPQLFPSDDLTDADLRFFAAEYVRKSIITHTSDEVPHATFIEILRYRETEEQHCVDAEVHVETDGQKAIIIGKKGALIRQIQSDAQRELEKLTGVPALIKCHVKISPKWRNNDAFLRDQGFFVK